MTMVKIGMIRSRKSRNAHLWWMFNCATKFAFNFVSQFVMSFPFSINRPRQILCNSTHNIEIELNNNDVPHEPISEYGDRKETWMQPGTTNKRAKLFVQRAWKFSNKCFCLQLNEKYWMNCINVQSKLNWCVAMYCTRA